MSTNDETPAGEPLLRIVRGAPTAEELAALVGVVIARSRPMAGSTGSAGPASSAWVRGARPGAFAASGMPSRPAAGAWRASSQPR